MYTKRKWINVKETIPNEFEERTAAVSRGTKVKSDFFPIIELSGAWIGLQREHMVRVLYALYRQLLFTHVILCL